MHATRNQEQEVSHARSRFDREHGLTGALLLFGALLCALTSSWVPQPLASVSCESPHEVVASDGWTTHVECAPIDARLSPIRGPARLLFGQTLDLNRADIAALEVLPHIGPSRAAAIVVARGQQRFASVDDLARVPGIGPRTIEALDGWASVEVAP